MTLTGKRISRLNKSTLLTASFFLLILIPRGVTGQPHNTTPSTYDLERKRLLIYDASAYISTSSQGRIDRDSATLLTCKIYGLSRLLPFNRSYDPECRSKFFQLLSSGKISAAKTSLTHLKGEDGIIGQLDLASYYLGEAGNQHEDLSNARHYIDNVLRQSAAAGLLKWRIEAMTLLARYHAQNGEQLEAIAVADKVIAACRENKDQKRLALAIALKGSMLPYSDASKSQALKQAALLCRRYQLRVPEIEVQLDLAKCQFLSSPSSSITILKEIVNMEKAIGYLHLQHIYSSLSFASMIKTDYIAAMAYAKTTLTSATSTGDRALLPMWYQRVGDMYIRLSNLEDAVKWYDKALALPRWEGSQLFWYNSFFTKAHSFLFYNKPAQALRFVDSTMRTFKPGSAYEQLTLAYLLGWANDDLNNEQEAELHYRNFLNLAVTFPRQIRFQEFGKGYYRIGLHYLDKKRYAIVQEMIGQTLAEGRRINSAITIADAYELKYKLDSAQGRMGDALADFKHFRNYLDTFERADQRRKYEELLIRYQAMQKDQHILSLRNNGKLLRQDLSRAKLEKQIILAGIAALVIIAGLLYYLFRQKQKSNRQLMLKQQEIEKKKDVLEQLVREKEWLLKEVHHRVKNNLQTIVSLLEHQSEYLTSDALAAIRDSQHRVYVMALIHQRLYLSDGLTTIPFADYVRELVISLRESFQSKTSIHLNIQLAPVDLTVNMAIPLGLIINEAVTNTIKYAFTEPQGLVDISGTYSGSTYTLIIADNGKGLPKNFDANRPGSLGFKLMRGLCREIGAEFTITSGQGTKLTTIFPVSDIQPV